MIDLHCHLLPGVDDGARDGDEALTMLRLAAETGTRAIVATPHSDLRYRFDVARCRDVLAELQLRWSGAPRLHLGCEVHLTPENVARVMSDPGAFTLNASDCLLLELPDRVNPGMVNPAIDALTSAGLRVVVAHPERNAYIQAERSYLDRLVDAGCYMQLTAASLNGRFGPGAAGAAAYALRRKLAHFIASDAHGSAARKPDLAPAYAAVAQSYGEPTARRLFIDNPEAAIAGLPIRDMPAASGWLSTLFMRSTNVFRKQAAAQAP